METYACVNMYHDTTTYMYPCHTPMSTNIAQCPKCAHAHAHVHMCSLCCFTCILLVRMECRTPTVRPGRNGTPYGFHRPGNPFEDRAVDVSSPPYLVRPRCTRARPKHFLIIAEAAKPEPLDDTSVAKRNLQLIRRMCIRCRNPLSSHAADAH